MSNTIPLNSKVIGLYRDFLENPKKHGCNYKPLKEVFKETDKYIPQDKLYNKYLDYIKMGPFIKERGPLNDRNTNQRLYKVHHLDEGTGH